MGVASSCSSAPGKPEFYEWLFVPEKLSGLSGNGPLPTEIQACTNEFNSVFALFKILSGVRFPFLLTTDRTDEPSVFLPLTLRQEELSKLAIESRPADK